MSNSQYDKYGIHLSNVNMFSEKTDKDSKIDIRMQAIRAFTSNDYSLQTKYSSAGFLLEKMNGDKLRLSYQGKILEFSKLSDLIYGGNQEELEQMKEILLNYEDRKGRCHIDSMRNIHLFSNIGDFLVTGYISNAKSDIRSIHTWIETENNAIDWTSNLVTSKKGYYKLMNVEVLSIIKKEDFLEDCKSKFLATFLGCKFYCLFRDELEREGLLQFGTDEYIKSKKK